MGFNYMIMKKISLLIIVLLSLSSYSQDTPGNLQFNKIINYTVSETIWGSNGGAAPQTFSTPIEVPNGKVWKITAINVAKYNGVKREACVQCGVEINGLLMFLSFHSQNGQNSNINNDSSFWLDSGSKTVRMFSNQNSEYHLSISAIEFNIID